MPSSYIHGLSWRFATRQGHDLLKLALLALKSVACKRSSPWGNGPPRIQDKQRVPWRLPYPWVMHADLVQLIEDDSTWAIMNRIVSHVLKHLLL